MGHLQSILFLSGKIPQISVLWGLAGVAAAAFMGRYVGLFSCVGQCPCVIVWVMKLCLGWGDLLSLAGLSEKSVISMISSSVSGSRSSNVLVHLGYGELALGVVTIFLATLASQDVASLLLLLVPSSKLKFFREGGVMDSVGSTFSLSELRYSGSSKNLGLYSVSVRLHGPESEVMLLLFFLGVNTPGSILGLEYPSLVGFFHSLNFSVCFSVSSTKVWSPVLVLTFTTRSMVPSGRSHEKNPFSKLHLEFTDFPFF